MKRASLSGCRVNKMKDGTSFANTDEIFRAEEEGPAKPSKRTDEQSGHVLGLNL